MKSKRHNKVLEIINQSEIETQEELECICNLHVHYGQGYYLGIPERKFNGVASQALEYLIPKQ